MRKVIEYVLTSADGVVEDPVGMGVAEYQDEAYLRDGLGLLTACDAILFGRRVYEAFAELYDGRTDHKPMWADRLTTIRKYVFSSTLERADWNNSIIVRGDAVAEVARLKQHDGGNLLLLGHGQFGETLEKTHSPSCKTRSTSNSTPSRYCSRRRSLPARKIVSCSGVTTARTSLYTSDSDSKSSILTHPKALAPNSGLTTAGNPISAAAANSSSRERTR